MLLNRLLKILMLLLFVTYCGIYPGSMYVLVTGNLPPGTEWMATFMLTLVGLVALLWVGINYGTGRGLLAGISVLMLGFVVEAVGVTTGFPFGRYFYTDVLFPKLFIVPIGIMFAWLMIILSSFFTARLILNWLAPRSGVTSIVVLSAVMALASDLLMEPVAFHVQGYWVWTIGNQAVGYYGVPVSNFVAWGVTSVLMVLVLTRITGATKKLHSDATDLRKMRFGFIPPALYSMNLLIFTCVNLAHSYYLAGGIGALVGGGCAIIALRAVNLDAIGPLAFLRQLRQDFH